MAVSFHKVLSGRQTQGCLCVSCKVSPQGCGSGPIGKEEWSLCWWPRLALG